MFNSDLVLDEYLGQIARELRGLPDAAREDELREIEAHLRALIEAGKQLENGSEAQATAAALQQFGPPKRVGRQLRRAWENKQPEEWWRAIVSPVLGLVFYALTWFVFWASAAVLSNFLPENLNAFWVMPLWYCITLAFSPVQRFATGFIMGCISPKYSQTILVTYLTLSSTAFIVWLATLGRAELGAFTSELSALDASNGALSIVSYICSVVALIFGSRCGAQRERRISASPE